MKMKETSRAQDKKLAVNNYLGRALKFYSSVRLEVRRVETLKSGGEANGNRVRIKVVKNKVAPPFKEAEIDIIFAEGISKTGDLVDVASQYDIIQKAGAWYAYGGEKIGQGREAAKKHLEERPELFDKIYEETLDAIKQRDEEKKKLR